MITAASFGLKVQGSRLRLWPRAAYCPYEVGLYRDLRVDGFIDGTQRTGHWGLLHSLRDDGIVVV